MSLTNTTVINIAKLNGFHLVGFSSADQLDIEIEQLNEWLDRDYQAGMDYMKRNRDKRRDVKKIFPSAKSVISLGINYYMPAAYSGDSNKGKISRYAWGKDYHLIIWEKLNKIISELKELDESFEAVSYVDTGPVMDKAWAVRSGLGWQGKHTNVINTDYGSWFFISNIICNWEFQYTTPVQDFCGTCNACILACPTGAIVEEYVLDSNRCISYLTIENKNEIPTEFIGKFDNWLFGCDICQDVCPWNIKFAFPSDQAGFLPKDGFTEFDLDDLLDLSVEQFNERFTESPIKRAKLSGLKRNAEFLKYQNKI